MKKIVTSPLHKREKREELNINVVANGKRSRMDMFGNETS
jgi:hypothetical protein